MSHEHTTSPYASKLEERLMFFFVFMGILTITFGVFFIADFLPEKPGTNSSKEQEETVSSESAPTTESETELEMETTDVETTDAPAITGAFNPYPTRLIIPKLERDIPVLNPQETSVQALDNALLSGVVRHPDSADFLNDGTMFLFGHSSYLPSVMNKNFQAFNGIQDLEWGDTIMVHSLDTEYVYQVERVYEVSAAAADIDLEMGTPRLTLVTCDSFGSKSDRFVVEASLVAKNTPIP